MISNKTSNQEFGTNNLQTSKMTNMLTFDESNMPKLIYDNETFDILFSNHAAAEIFGYTEDELLKLKLTDICIDDFSALVDSGKVELPIKKLNRVIQSKNGALTSCKTKSYELDFETSVLMFHNILPLNKEYVIYSVLQHMN
jgi:PAS domain S-box-containing protein